MSVSDKQIESILQPGDESENHSREQRVRDGFWKTLRRAARRIPFVEDLVAAYYCALDRRTPVRVRGVLLAALAYFVLPLDLVPDLFLLAGFADDIAVLAFAINTLGSYIKPEHYEAARKALNEEEVDLA